MEFPRHKPTGVAVLRGARVITMHGDEVLDDADIVVKDNRIVAVGKRGSASLVRTTRRSSTWPARRSSPASSIRTRTGTRSAAACSTLQNWSFFANLAYGVTTGRDPQTATNDMFAYQDMVDTGEMVGPRAYSTGPGVFPDTDFQSLEDATGVVERYKQVLSHAVS